MADEVHSEGTGAGEGSHADAQVLGYLATAATPTRVRHVAADLLAVVGFLTFIASLFLAAMWVLAYPRIFADFLQRINWSHALVIMSRHDFPRLSVPVLLFPSLLFSAVVMILCIKPVRAGRKAACVVAAFPVAWVTLIAVGAAAAIGAFAFFSGTGIGMYPQKEPANPAQLWWLLGTIVFIPCVGLLVDLLSSLAWIARNPATEKPRMRFIPRFTSRR